MTPGAARTSAPVRPVAPGLLVPRLTGIPAHAGTADGEQFRARLALACLDAGVAPAALWRGDPQRFVADALAAWVAAHGGAEVARRFDLSIWLDTEIAGRYARAYGYGSAGDAESERLFLCYEPAQAASYLELGAAYAWLERAHPRLPATLDRALLELHRVTRVYDHRDAREFEQLMEDGMDEEDLKLYREEKAPLAVPASLARRPLSRRALRRLRDGWPRGVRRVADAVLALHAAADRFGTRSYPSDREDLIGDMQLPNPGLIVAFSQSDAICAAFDEEMSQAAQLGEPTEPSAFWEIAAPEPAAVRRAFDGLARALAVVRAAARLADALPGQGAFVFDTGRPLAEVLAEGEGENAYETPVAAWYAGQRGAQARPRTGSLWEEAA